MTPDELRTRSFTVAMRGYDRAEVDRVVSEAAAELQRLAARVEDLEQRAAAAARESTGDDPMDAYRSLGERTTAILVQAETAARQQREEAEAEAARLREEAAVHAERVTGEADEHARTVRAEADAHARQVRDDADAEARERVEDASRRAASEVAAAERAARERGETASAHARKVVEDAEARRDEVEAERARIDAARAGLVAGLRAAVDAVAAEVDLLERAPGPDAESDAGPDAEPDAGSDAESGGEPDAGSEDGVSSSSPAHGSDAPVPDEPDLDAPAAGAAAVPAASRDAEGPGVATVDAPDRAAEVPGQDGPGDDDAPVAVAPSPVAVAVTQAAVVAGREAPAVSDEPVAPSMLRERSLAAVRPGMLRRLRRGLQELQNGALESLRERSRDADADALLPGEDVAEQLVEVARGFLDAAYRVGAGDAPVLRGGDPDPDAEADRAVVEEAAAMLAGGLVHELRTTLRPSLAAGLDADEADASLSERVGEVFRDIKGPVVEGLVDEHLTRIYGTATNAAWAVDGVEQVRWVLGEEARCPEGACRGNAGEDPQPVGATFPSGHAVPPVHEGCTCALAPA